MFPRAPPALSYDLRLIFRPCRFHMLKTIPEFVQSKLFQYNLGVEYSGSSLQMQTLTCSSERCFHEQVKSLGCYCCHA